MAAASGSGYTRAATIPPGHPTCRAKAKVPETPSHEPTACAPEVQDKKKDGTGETAPIQSLLDAVMLMRTKYKIIWNGIYQEEATTMDKKEHKKEKKPGENSKKPEQKEKRKGHARKSDRRK